ncbi:unnamed protein product [Triticum turgidum subsp. durum]|uniref:Peptidase A1 domain-containing protein n=1 Tax=Triticum turgidum subsp. durum TaxID=4567 RepID=A0A9R0QFZ2_TRITD|nr:unnamed protein product [Triticum turgidum subsp. durum]
MARCGVAVLVLILLACVAAAAAGGRDHHHRRGSRASARLQLVPAAPGASLAERARDDRHRHAYISRRLASSASSSRRRAAETSTAPGPEASAFAMPLTSGAYTGTGQYFVKFRVGTPAQPFVLVADTGSDLTWVKCRVLSLGNSNISFAARAAARFGGRFSYCLVDHLAPRNTSSYLTFGPDANGAASSSRTPLLLDAQVAPFYAVTVDAVSVAGEALDIPAEVWDVKKSGGAILDSGTSLTILATPAYKAVVAALSKQLAGVPRVTMDPFEYCYNWTATSTPPAVPKLEVRFAGSARLQPPTKSYVIDAAPGVKCIGLQEGVWPGVSVIGNILQQEHLWEFDLANRWLRFKESRCAQ